MTILRGLWGRVDKANVAPIAPHALKIIFPARCPLLKSAFRSIYPEQPDVTLFEKCRALAGEHIESSAQFPPEAPRPSLLLPPLLIFIIPGTPKELIKESFSAWQQSHHRQGCPGSYYSLDGRIVSVVLETPRVGAHDIIVNKKPRTPALSAKNPRKTFSREFVCARALPGFSLFRQKVGYFLAQPIRKKFSKEGTLARSRRPGDKDDMVRIAAVWFRRVGGVSTKRGPLD